MSLFLVHKMLTHSLRIAKEIAKELEKESSKIEKETPKHMEEIKLPKFKTKEELEQFAMGLMTENESLKKVITLKDETIKSLDKQLGDFLEERLKYVARLNKIQDLEAEIKSLKENLSENKYKKYYEKEHREHIATKIRCTSSELELDKTNRKVHKLCSMVTYMFGLLPRFKAKQVTDMYGKFVVEDYRL